MMMFSADQAPTRSIVDPDIFSGVMQVHTAEAATRVSSLTYNEIVVLVKKYAEPLHVNQKSMLETINCEAPRNDNETFNPLGRSEIIGPDKIREDSWGLSQINLPAHPGITLSQAQDADFSIRFMAEEFAAGHAWKWTCWRTLKKSGRI